MWPFRRALHCQKLDDLFLLLETAAISGFNTSYPRIAILWVSTPPSEIDSVESSMISRVYFSACKAQIVCILYARMWCYVALLKLVGDCEHEESECQILKRWRTGWPLFAQENWPRAATLAPFLGDRFAGTTTPRKAEINVLYNCHGNVVRETGSFTLCRTRPLA